MTINQSQRWLVVVATFGVVTVQPETLVAQDKSQQRLLAGCGSKYVFDSEFYALRYTDVCAATDLKYTGLLTHWLLHGVGEGRSSSPVFDVRYYLEHHLDLQHAFRSLSQEDKYQAAVTHWMNHGIDEGRRGSPVFWSKWYLENHPDLTKAFGPRGFRAAIDHYLFYGLLEKRKSNPEDKTLANIYFPTSPSSITHHGKSDQWRISVPIELPVSSRYTIATTISLELKLPPSEKARKSIKVENVPLSKLEGWYLTDPAGCIRLGGATAPFGVSALEGGAVYPLLLRYAFTGTVSGEISVNLAFTNETLIPLPSFSVDGKLAITLNGTIKVDTPRMLPYPVEKDGWEYKDWDKPGNGVKRPGFGTLNGWPELLHLEVVPGVLVVRLYMRPVEHAVKIECSAQIIHNEFKRDDGVSITLVQGLKHKDHFEVTTSGVIGAPAHEWSEFKDKAGKIIENTVSKDLVLGKK